MNKEKIKKIIIEYSSGDRDPITDKGSCHAYEEFYSEYFIRYLNKKINLLEVGIAGGASLKMWEKIFPLAQIYGADQTYDYVKCTPEELQTITLLPPGDQTNPTVFNNIPNMDIIIDDASHASHLSIQTFEILKNKINHGGVYIIEDVWEEQLKEYPKEFLKQFKIIDLRSFKNRGDDILLVYEKD